MTFSVANYSPPAPNIRGLPPLFSKRGGESELCEDWGESVNLKLKDIIL